MHLAVAVQTPIKKNHLVALAKPHLAVARKP